jgi:hypothetical protein
MLILYYTVTNLLPSYFQEKGKNLATKDDIAKITQLVESVKHTFTVETEKLKANLSLLTNVHSGLVSEERNAIIDFNEKYFLWLNIITDTSNNNLDDTKNSELEDHRRLLGKLYQDLLNSEARFSLFVDNAELTAHVTKVKIETLKRLANFPRNSIFALMQVNLEIDNMYSTIPVGEQVAKYKELLNKKAEVYDEFRANMIREYAIVAPIVNAFQKACRDHIYKLIKAQEESIDSQK